MDSILEGLNASGRIKAIMATRDISKADLGILLKCTGETIGNRLEADKWDYKDLAKIADAYGIKMTDLI